PLERGHLLLAVRQAAARAGVGRHDSSAVEGRAGKEGVPAPPLSNSGGGHCGCPREFAPPSLQAVRRVPELSHHRSQSGSDRVLRFEAEGTEPWLGRLKSWERSSTQPKRPVT